MKLENVNPRHIHEAAEAAVSDLSRYNEQEREELFNACRYRTVTGFLGSNPRQVKRTDEEIERDCDIEIACMEHFQDQRKQLLVTLYSAANVALDISAKMSLTTEEFVALSRYFS